MAVFLSIKPKRKRKEIYYLAYDNKCLGRSCFKPISVKIKTSPEMRVISPSSIGIIQHKCKGYCKECPIKMFNNKLLLKRFKEGWNTTKG